MPTRNLLYARILSYVLASLYKGLVALLPIPFAANSPTHATHPAEKHCSSLLEYNSKKAGSGIKKIANIPFNFRSKINVIHIFHPQIILSASLI
jgi:hypothetical protein